MRSRIVHYSRTGATRLLAEALAARLVADLAEIRCGRYPRGPLGFLRAGFDSLRRARPEVHVAPAEGPADCLLVGSPVWAGRLSAPVRGFLSRLDAAPGRVGVFLTSGSSGPHPAAEAELAGLLGRAPDALLVLSADDVRAGRHMDAVEDFLRALAQPPDRPSA